MIGQLQLNRLIPIIYFFMFFIVLFSQLKLSAFILIFYAISNCDCKSIKPLSDKGREIWFNETIPSNRFGASGFGGLWISGTEFTFTENRGLVKFDVVTNQTKTLYDSDFAVSIFGLKLM